MYSPKWTPCWLNAVFALGILLILGLYPSTKLFSQNVFEIFCLSRIKFFTRSYLRHDAPLEIPRSSSIKATFLSKLSSTPQCSVTVQCPSATPQCSVTAVALNGYNIIIATQANSRNPRKLQNEQIIKYNSQDITEGSHLPRYPFF